MVNAETRLSELLIACIEGRLAPMQNSNAIPAAENRKMFLLEIIVLSLKMFSTYLQDAVASAMDISAKANIWMGGGAPWELRRPNAKRG